jgi:hypothetical protein
MSSATPAMAASPVVTTELLTKFPLVGRDHSDPTLRVKSRL